MENKLEKAYAEILKCLNKHKDIIVYDIEDLKRKSKNHIFGAYLKDIYGLNIDPSKINSLEWNKFGDYLSIGKWGEKYRRTISWSLDGTQPVDETLLQISFPTGPYIFGEDYPTELFKLFFDELRAFGPKYIDMANKNLYFSLDNSKDIFNNFNDILAKYRKLNQEDSKRREIKKLEEQLTKLKQ